MKNDPMNPFGLPGASPKASDEIFIRNKMGSGGRSSKRQADENALLQLQQDSEEDFKAHDQVKEPQPVAKPEVRLFNPKWGEEHGAFNEKISASVEGELPPEISHVTKVAFVLHSKSSGGKKDRMEVKEVHLKDGKAVAEFTLMQPDYIDAEGKATEKIEFLFSAKHRDSKEIESPGLYASKKELRIMDFREILETIETETDYDSAKVFASALDYKALCELALKGTVGNEPDKMPSRFFLLPGADDAVIEVLDSHPEEKPHQISIANLRKGLIALGYQCPPKGSSFDPDLRIQFEEYLRSLTFPKKSNTTKHKVRKGETLGGIALMYGLPGWHALYALNSGVIGASPDRIEIGLDLKIPSRNTARGEQLIRQRGGDPGKWMGGLRYDYPWVVLSLNLTDEQGNPVSLKRERNFQVMDSLSEMELAKGKIRSGSRLTCLVPNSKSVSMIIEGLELKIQDEFHRTKDS